MKIRSLFVVALLVVPFVLVSLPGIPGWLSRTLATALLVFGFTIGILFYGFNPKTKLILPGGKLNEPKYDAARPAIGRNIRILVVMFGTLVSFYITLPFSIDLVRLAGGETPLKITEIVQDRSVPLFGLWFLEQSVKISQAKNRKYQLYYSWKPLKVGETYEFTVLPRSRVILDFRESRENIGARGSF